MNVANAVEMKFIELFHKNPILVRSPGRVNLIGEHTDYNHGFVLPGAIDKAIYLAVGPRKDQSCKVYALDKKEEHQFELHDLRSSPKGWPNYLIGVVDQILKAGHQLGGMNCVFGGDIPIGAGLSSSAALEAGTAFALRHLYNLQIGDLDLVKLSQRAENEFVGVKCGIMDQFINVFGKQDNVLLIDCRSLEHTYYPFDHDVSIVLFDTRVSHSLASTEYNRRREECSEGTAIVHKSHPTVTHLRDVSIEMLDQHKDHMSPTIFRRCRYVVGENDRVLKGCRALQEGNLKLFGEYMFETHKGLSLDYQVSCAELDYLVGLVKDDPAVYGARMMGGGFGGCTINLIKKGTEERISKNVSEQYERRFGRTPNVYVTSIGAGTNFVSLSQNR